MKDLVKIEGGEFYYTPSQILLKNINFNIQKHDFIAITGDNGTGKTSLLKLLLGQLEWKAGNLQQSFSKIAYVSQLQGRLQEFFPATVFEIVSLNLYRHVSFFPKHKKMIREKVKKALESVSMLQYQNHLFGELSGGQKQKVLLAKAFVDQVDLLILDEPTTGLDQESTEDFFQSLVSLFQKKEMSILVVSHELEKLKQYCPKIYALQGGELHATI